VSTATVHQLDPDRGRDATIEAFLDQHHIQWTFEPALDLETIDMDRSLRNQARSESIDQDVVDIYAGDMARGDRFPPLIVHRAKRARKVVLFSGIHRSHAALKAKLATQPAYVCVDVAADVQPAIAYWANRNHGKQLDRQERMRQGAHLVALGWTQAAAADAVGIKPGDVSKAIAVQDGTRRANELSVAAEWATLPFGHRERIAQVANDEVFAAVVELAFDAKLTQQQVDEVKRQVAAARTETKQLQAVGGFREEVGHQAQRAGFGKTNKIRANDGRAATPYTKVKDAVLVLIAADPAAVWASCPTAEVEATLRRQLRDAANQCMTIGKAKR
jgi:hypothetical protein